MRKQIPFMYDDVPSLQNEVLRLRASVRRLIELTSMDLANEPSFRNTFDWDAVPPTPTGE